MSVWRDVYESYMLREASWTRKERVELVGEVATIRHCSRVQHAARH